VIRELQSDEDAGGRGDDRCIELFGIMINDFA
jgi:hypothetical protein